MTLDRKKKALLFLLLAAIFTFSLAKTLSPIILRSMAHYLIYESSSLHFSDIGVVLSGDNGYRVEHAAQLYHDGKVGKLLMTGGLLYRDPIAIKMKDHAIELGVPSRNIIVEIEATSTLENAQYSLEKLKAMGIDEATIITSKSHTRRSYYVYRRIFGASDIAIQVSGSKDDVKYDSWWTHGYSKEVILLEWAKLVWYKLNGYI